MPPELYNSRFLKAARCEPTDTTPVWIMRQAGRYLPEYMAVRSRTSSVLELCQRSDLAAQVTLEARELLQADAAILFADLPPLLIPLGFELEYTPGPVIHNPFRTGADLARVRPFDDPETMGYVYETARLVRSQLPADIPLLGFAGAPFTLASYAVEGGGSRNYVHTKKLMYNEPDVWQELMQRFTSALAVYLQKQIEAGCQAVQIFDSWAGCLSPADYRQYVLPWTKQLIDSVPQDVPVINFLTGNPALLAAQREAGGRVMGVDWRIDLGEAWDIFGHDRAIQGNLDPVALYADLPVLKEKTAAVMNAAGGRPGHIFNLGHGVLPDMDPDRVKALVQMVHELGAR
ncbi:MAG: uroporphyrinogen decarboxylase [Planctomycetaceae bacterium]|nr:uroporphyrinogen decarboxylase [Planctomycetaceae bacterium]